LYVQEKGRRAGVLRQRDGGTIGGGICPQIDAEERPLRELREFTRISAGKLIGRKRAQRAQKKL
jgi:hypothetical protein